MARYTVWHSTGKFDGDSVHATLAEAIEEFDDQRSRSDVIQVELIDLSGDEPVVLQSWNAADVGGGDPDPCTL